MAARRLAALALGLVWIAAILSHPDGAFAQGVTKATLTGTFVLDRSKPADPCITIVPPIVKGTLRLMVDLDKGQVTGDFSGGGSGEMTARGNCGAQPPDQTYKADTKFSGTISGTIDRTSGAISGQFKTNAYSGNLIEVMLRGKRCYIPTMGMTDWATECPVVGANEVQTAPFKGTVKADGSASGDFTWHTNYCQKEMADKSQWCSAEENIRNGTWTAKGPAIQLLSTNRAPMIQDFGYTPDYPETDDEIVLTVKAFDLDEDKLSYAWTLDGNRMSVTGSSATYRNPSAGDHQVTITVSDGKGGSDRRSLSIYVAEHVGAKDSDKDGVDDDKDKCPNEPGPPKDGCPPFDVILGCDAASPTEGDSINCSAQSTGVHKDETVEYNWFLDGSSMQSGASASYGWKAVESRAYAVRVVATGQEGRSATKEVSLNVGVPAEFVAHIGLFPDPPVPDKPVILSASVDGSRPNEKLSFSWTLDGAALCTASACTAQVASGGHFAQLVVQGDGRQATAERVFQAQTATVASGDAVAAGFSVSVGCTSDITSDDTLACTASVLRSREDVDLVSIDWFIDGVQASSDSGMGTTFSWGLPQPAPGEHRVEIRVTDLRTGNSMAGATVARVQPGSNAAIPPLAQTAAAVGTTAALGTWLWLEWLTRKRAEAREADAQAEEDAREAALVADRREWYERVMDLNDQARAAGARVEAEQQALAEEWDRLYNGLLEASEAGAKVDRLLDFVDRHAGDVCKDGVWDREQMDRLQALVTRVGQIQTERDQFNARVKFANSLRPEYEAVFDLSKNATFRIGSDIVTGGYAEAFWIPVSAARDALEATERGVKSEAERIKIRQDAYWQAARETLALLLWEQVLAQGARAAAPELQAAAGWIEKQSPDSAKKMWNTLNTPLEDSARNLVDRLRSQTALPGVRQMEGLKAVNPDLANDVGQIMANGGRIKLESVDMLSRGQRATLTADEEVARRLLNNVKYREGVDKGLIPRQAHEAVNHVRDKLVKNAVISAYESLPPNVQKQIARIEFTGTGARPHLATATSGWTDLDLTVRARPGAGGPGELAERAFRDSFRKELQAAGVAEDVAEVKMFAGLRASPDIAPAAGYGSPELIRWQETDVAYRARCAIPTEKGGMVFNAHPDVSPMPGQGPLSGSLTRPAVVDAARAVQDVRRVALDDIRELPQHLGRPPNRIDILRYEGKHVRRAWWSSSAGQGAEPPPFVRILDAMKSDRTYTPSPAEVDEAWNGFVQFLDLRAELGGIR